MSKTVLLPDDLYDEIQKTEIVLFGATQTMSMAKKIKLFFDWYKMDNEGFDGHLVGDFSEHERRIKNMIHDAYIRGNKGFTVPSCSTQDVAIKL